MSAFEVYVWLTIPGYAFAVVFLGLMAIFCVVATYFYNASEAGTTYYSNDAREIHAARLPGLRKLGYRLLALVALAGLVPSRDTVALMYVLPEIANAEAMATMKSESAELYDIAKKALIKMAEGEKEE